MSCYSTWFIFVVSCVAAPFTTLVWADVDALSANYSSFTRDSGPIIGKPIALNVVPVENYPKQSANAIPRSNENRPTFSDGMRVYWSAIMAFIRNGDEYSQAEPRDMTPPLDMDYDFIVVGAGSAGAAVASRLSEVPDVTVLLIEAGRSESLVMDIPLLVNYLQFSNDINWKYRTESSNQYCRGMNDHRCNWPRGKVMGGSSVLNYMIATRGNYRDYDLWAEMGNDGWSYNDVLPYFKKMEKLNIPILNRDKTMHNTEGPLVISYPPYHTLLADAFLEAGREMGFDTVDYNGHRNIGFSYIQTTTVNGTRMSANRAYLHPAKYRRNLFVSKNSLVSRVLIDQSGQRAVGVEFLKRNRKYSVRARKEVILCAGAIGTPQLLMLSGIGPAKHLADMGIPLVKDAAVGKNLMDHIAYGGLVFLVDKPNSIVSTEVVRQSSDIIVDYVVNHGGPLGIPGGCEAIAFFDVDDVKDRDARPSVELLFQGASIVSDPFVRHGFGIANQVWQKSYRSVAGRHSWSIFPMLLNPKSRGVILLRNRDIRSAPRLIPNYLEDPEDVRIIVAAIRSALAVGQTKSMQEFGTKLHAVPLAGCEHHVYDSDAYWECAARTLTFTIYHHAGTCKMGPKSDPEAVVSPRLQVYGVKGLRVADASIMPVIPSAHTHIPSVMIGEKLADMVKEDWGYPTDTSK